MRIGVVTGLKEGPESALERVAALGLHACQVTCWDARCLSDGVADKLREMCVTHDVKITTIWTGMPGRYVWDLVEGPDTIGLVPEKTRRMRLEALKRGSDFARRVGVSSITSHVGFIPENPSDPLYPGVVDALREIAAHCRSNGQAFWFETGQETPVALLRTIEDVGTDNLGINLDPANLLMYGKANPVDALDIIGTYVRDVHAKDGEYPTNGRRLGVEKPLGQGRVDFPVLIRKLASLGFQGTLTIEREISGPQQIEDIKRGIRYLEQILSSL